MHYIDNVLLLQLGIPEKNKMGQEITVLIIEKEQNSVSEIRDWAFRNPVIPVFVSSGIEALLWLGKGNIPDFILADAQMQSMAGPEFIRTLKSSGFFQEIPVVAFGYPEHHPVLASMRQAGASGHLFLPTDAEALKQRFSHFFEKEMQAPLQNY